MRGLEYHDEGPMEGEAEDVTGVSKVDAAGLNSPGSYSDGHGGVDMLAGQSRFSRVCRHVHYKWDNMK